MFGMYQQKLNVFYEKIFNHTAQDFVYIIVMIIIPSYFGPLSIVFKN
jgi:hypothetical protein